MTTMRITEDGTPVLEAAPAASAPPAPPAPPPAPPEAPAIPESPGRAVRQAALLGRLLEAQLPGPVTAKLRAQLGGEGRTYPDGLPEFVRTVEEAIEAERAMLAQLRDAIAPAPGAPRVTGHGGARVTAHAGGRERGVAAAQVAMDRLFGVVENADDPAARELAAAGAQSPRWSGIREAYVAITGDAGISGVPRPELSLAREANEVTTTVLNQVVLNSMTKRLVQDYASQPQDWRRFVNIRAIRDYKSQDRIRLADFASLPTVAEGGAYVNQAWDDAKESYVPVKKGTTVVVTREAILNDDIDAIRKVPAKLGIAAATTINEFVYGLFTTNPTMADATKVFDDGVQTAHANRLTSSLSATALQSAMTLVMKQTNSAGKRIGARPRFLLVPPDILFTGMTLMSSTLVPGSMNNDANVLKGALEVISVPQFTDVTDWYVIADPTHVEGIEVGFIGGRDAPEMLMQDAPSEGQVFTNDQISFKVRWEFGGGWVDYRGAVWSQVAG